jgi:hypothetical protein
MEEVRLIIVVQIILYSGVYFRVSIVDVCFPLLKC